MFEDKEKPRWYTDDPMEICSRTVDTLPVNDSTYLKLYEHNLRTVADVVDAYQQQNRVKPWLVAAFHLTRQSETAQIDSLRKQGAMNYVWERLVRLEQNPLEAWPFDTRTINALKANGIQSLSGLVRYYPVELLKMRNVGLQRLVECRQFLAFHNLCFGLR